MEGLVWQRSAITPRVHPSGLPTHACAPWSLVRELLGLHQPQPL